MSSAEINFEEAFSILSKNDEYLTLEDAHELVSLFVPVNLEEIEGTHFTREDVKNLINKFKNEQSNKNEQLSALLKNMNETIDRNALYQIFKTGNRISFKEFEEFLTHLNLNQTKINTQELYHNLLQQYLLYVSEELNGKASTEDFDYTVDHNRNINIYTAKGNVMFNKVVKGTKVIWETNDPTKYASKVFTDLSAKNVSIYLMNGDIEHYHKGGIGEPWKIAPSRITLDISKTSSTIGFDFNHDGERRTFTPKPGYFFSRVIISDILQCEFWEPKDPSVCINKVVIFGVESTIRNVSIFLSNNTVEHFHKEYDEWVAETAMILNIDINYDNDLFDYRSTRGFGHFNPKANLTVEKIVKRDLNIWSADPEDHGLKVVLMGSGKDVKHLSILLQSGKFVLLSKSGKGKPWQEITMNKHNFSGVRLFSLDESTSKYHELTREDYEPIVFECRYGYEFRNDVRCVKIINTFLSSLFKSQLITTKYYQ